MLPSSEATRPGIGDAYLKGFDLLSADDSEIFKLFERGSGRERERLWLVWNFDIYQHPESLLEGTNQRYINIFGLYSLGVLLLEIGFWQPLREIAKNLTTEDPAVCVKELSEIALQLGARTGERYQSLVLWCLS